MSNERYALTGAVALLALLATFTAADSEDIHARFGVTFSFEPYAEVLTAYVDDGGLVDYAGLKRDREKLHPFVRDVAGLYREIYQEWSDNEQIAFWLNTYNVLTLQSIVDHYPIKSDWKKRVVYPVGIRHIPDVWSAETHTVKGFQMSLDQMEHEVLRKEFNEPRIHMALVCAARGCPRLRREPYAAEHLDDQLDDQTRSFLADPEKFRLDHESRVVHLSSIFKWYAADFSKKYGTPPFAAWAGDDEQGVLNFVAGYLPDEDVEKLRTGTYSVKYLDYDWSLNDEATP